MRKLVRELLSITCSKADRSSGTATETQIKEGSVIKVRRGLQKDKNKTQHETFSCKKWRVFLNLFIMEFKLIVSIMFRLLHCAIISFKRNMIAKIIVFRL